MNRWLREALGYGAASAVALLVDVSILWLLVQKLHLGYLGAATLGFLAGACVAYALSVTLVFRNHRLRDRRAEFAGFVAIGVVGLGINAGVILLAVKTLGLHYLVGKGIATGCTFTYNFVARRQLLFAPPAA